MADEDLLAPDIDWIHGEPDIEDNIDDNVTDTSSPEYVRWYKRRHKKKKTPRERIQSNLTVISAVVAGVLVAAVKFAAAIFTGSVAMIAEGIHSLVDAANDSLLLIGKRASKKEPDVRHPFGYGALMFFYTFVVSVIIFFAGGGISIYQGISALISGDHALSDPWVNYLVLGIGIILEGVSLSIALRDVNRARGEMGIADYIKQSTDPAKFTVFLEDSAAVIGMVIAIVGIALSQAFDMPGIEAAASIMIGLIMAAVATVLLRETRSLLIGEGLGRDEIEEIVFIVEDDPAVIKCGRVLSMYLGPNDLLLNLDVTFDDELDEGDVLQAVDRIEAELMDEYPQAKAVFIEAESLNQVYRQRLERKEAFEADEEDD